MKYLVNIYAIHADGLEEKIVELKEDDYTFLDICDDAESEIEWQIGENRNSTDIEAYRYVVYNDIDGQCFMKVIEIERDEETNDCCEEYYRF